MKYKDLPPDKCIGSFQWNHQAHLGSGAFGSVYLGKNTKDNNNLVAIKALENSKIVGVQKDLLQNEVTIMKTIKGNNVVSLIDYLQTANRTYLVQLFCNQGDLEGLLKKKGKKLPEPEAKHILNDLLLGYQELINNNFIHRDLKPENVLIHDGYYRLADYGLGTKIQSTSEVLTMGCGSPLYMSPQILNNQPYTAKTDIWSMGVMYYQILFGTTPWNVNSIEQLAYKTQRQPARLPYGCKISKESEDFIMRCLQPNEQKRLSWEQAFQHPIFTKKAEELTIQKKIELSKETIEAIKRMQKEAKKAGWELEALFQDADQSGDGKLTQSESIKFFKKLYNKITDQQAELLFQNFDQDQSGYITLDEFKDFFLNTGYGKPKENKMLTEQWTKRIIAKLVGIIYAQNINIDILFRSIDKSQDQNLDFKEFMMVIKQLDDQIEESDAYYVFRKFDKDGSGSISIKEFEAEIIPRVEQLGGDPTDKKDYGKISESLPPHVQKIIHDIRKLIAINNLKSEFIFQSIDKDASSKLNFNEFAGLVRMLDAKLSQSDIQQIFNAFDRNKDGDVSLQEFQEQIDLH